jgi:predicted transcriptional regulator
MQQVTISIPQPLYQRVRNLASAQNRPVDTVLETAISLAEAAADPQDAQVAAMVQEETAYQAMHAELVRSHLGDYVAIYQGQLIDHDPDELRLLRRLDKAYPNEVVLMKQVRTAPQTELRHRSPRLE